MTNRRRIRNNLIVAAAAGAVVVANAPVVSMASTSAITTFEQSRPAYKARLGSWKTVELPREYQVNAIHSVLLSTGKVLIVAGSGNDIKAFKKGTFRSVLWDPVADTYTDVPTPKDLFCGGHAFLPDGNVLIAGGTAKYEVLAGKVERAAGVMTVHNATPNSEPFTIHKGDTFTSQKDGRRYRATDDVVVAPAHASLTTLHPSSVDVWVEAIGKGKEYAFTNEGRHFTLDGLDVPGLYGIASNVNLDKQEYRGLDASYVFDVHAEKYVATGDMKHARWYPTLFGTTGGDVVAVAGLDQYGIVDPGNTERFSAKERTWTAQPQLQRYFPTYPALFRMADERVFYSGSNAGYGPADKGRAPGVWNLQDNTFATVPGLRDADMTETSSSVLLPPAQAQKVMVVGGGSVGDKAGSTARTDVVDLTAPRPRFTPGPDLPSPARYVSTVVLPDDTVLMTGGSSDYRGRSDSDVHEASLYDPRTGALRPAAPPKVGRNYHSEALLLPDGRVLTMGSDPLYSDPGNSIPGSFEKRVEIYSPPYLYDAGERPRITEAPTEVRRGSSFPVRTAAGIASARLVRPSAVTHVTDVEQRSVALGITRTADGAVLTLDRREGVAPTGWYMLFVNDADGTPSTGHWVHVS